MTKCSLCAVVLDQPERHAMCRECVGQLRVGCKHARRETGEGGRGGEALPRSKSAKLEPASSMSADDLRKELGRWGLSTDGTEGELAARLEEHRRSDAGNEEAEGCGWEGMVCQLSDHVAECPCEPAECPNKAAGCQESVRRNDAARHSSETCSYRQVTCAHCRNPFEARALPEHEGICQEAKIECPNAGCDEMVARGSMGEHRRRCGREVGTCPFPGCEVRVARAEMEQHCKVAWVVHTQLSCRRAAMVERRLATMLAEQGAVVTEQTAVVAEQGRTIVAQAEATQEQSAVVLKQNEQIAALISRCTTLTSTSVATNHKVLEQERVIVGLQRRAEALTRVFTWSTDSSLSRSGSLPYTFTDGVRGKCVNSKTVGQQAGNYPQWVSFTLEEGPACTLHFKCSILGKDDKALRVIAAFDDVQKPPSPTAAVGLGRGCMFNLTEAEKASAVRADGSIKFRMVVHLYLP